MQWLAFSSTLVEGSLRCAKTSCVAFAFLLNIFLLIFGLFVYVSNIYIVFFINYLLA